MIAGKQQKRLALAVATAVSLHVLMCLVCILSPGSLVARSYPGRLYQKFFLVGPFFSDERIRATPQTYVDFYSINEGWHRPTHYGHEHFLAYHHAPWRYARLKRADFERSLFRNTFGKNPVDFQGTEQLRAAAAYIEHELLAGEAVDSVRVLYVIDTWLPRHGKMKRDTLVDYRYKPGALPHAE